METILISKDSHDKYRIVELSCTKTPDKEEYTIGRRTGLIDGKLIEHTKLILTKGRAKRTVQQQAELEYHSHLKKYLDKGYKKLEDLNCSSLEDFRQKQSTLTNFKTDTKGIGKPMLCTVYDKNDKKTQNTNWLISRKLDGQS